ncbi:hypothetical protein DVH24_038759 [Malus domestica]|uniref:Pentatricopeptide repeat-containing protein n=1 Tax=Malus domestica TaxID=3750 RepID=A0A498KFG0_MALDO|nr:hypothetical protein DVH24_038759 [Malus domestica]
MVKMMRTTTIASSLKVGYGIGSRLRLRLRLRGLIREAKKLLTKMEERGCPRDNYTYNTIVRGIINKNETSRAI